MQPVLRIADASANASSAADAAVAYFSGGGGTPDGFDVSLSSTAYQFSFWWAMCAVVGAAVPRPRTLAQTMFTTVTVFFGFLAYGARDKYGGRGECGEHGKYGERGEDGERG